MEAQSELAPALSVEALVRRYGDARAVDGVSFFVKAGEVFGLLGPNGAGKTTIISVLATLLPPTSGHARVLGHDVRRETRVVRRIIGVVPQEVSLYPKLSGAENIRFFGHVYGLRGSDLEDRIASLLGLVGLRGRADDPVSAYSGGMKRRLNLAVSLVHRPRAVLLDEPTAGVDPQSREHIFDVVRGLREAGNAVLYTTHYLEEAEQLCDRLAIIDEGRVIAGGTLHDLLHDPRARDPAIPSAPPRLENLFLNLTGRRLRD